MLAEFSDSLPHAQGCYSVPAARAARPIQYRVHHQMATTGRKFDQPNPFSDPVEREIYEAHRRFVEVMESDRLATISAGTKQQYLRIMQSLAEKLAIPTKPLSEIVGEVMSEAAPLLFQAMQR